MFSSILLSFIDYDAVCLVKTHGMVGLRLNIDFETNAVSQLNAGIISGS